ncbi:hypothetical protein SCOR_25875 [Sulfidibacter corallicola]|uniref:Uncharacterized protein n=1 Tax=Sulfidibacter corallicola TaxID=2818388 RepID=A0A8A4TQB4_SULCO|nr:hypothetical protein [Sulfidibacter corallicola]QTD52176.1 hypothetical protein J3U87_06845 [Sulfidibacter corallicola]
MKPFLLFLLVVACHADEPRRTAQVLKASATLKVYKTERLNIYYTRGFSEHAEALGREGERFLAELGQRWSVILPEEPVHASVIINAVDQGRPHHLSPTRWLEVSYNQSGQRIEFRISRQFQIDQEHLNAELRHYLVHHYLRWDHPEPLPFFLEEGLAQYYDGTEPNGYRYKLILGFRALSNPGALTSLDQAAFFHGFRGAYFAAVSEQFVRWLWQEYPDSEVTFIQRHLLGQPLSDTLRNARLPDMDELLDRYFRDESAKHPMSAVTRTPDFWMIVFGILFLIGLAIKTLLAIRVARIPHVEIGTVAENPGSTGGPPKAKPTGPGEPVLVPTGPAFDASPNAPISDLPLPDLPLPDLPAAPASSQSDPFQGAAFFDAADQHGSSQPAPPTTAPPQPRDDDHLFAQQSQETIVFLDDEAAPPPPTPARPSRREVKKRTSSSQSADSRTADSIQPPSLPDHRANPSSRSRQAKPEAPKTAQSAGSSRPQAPTRPERDKAETPSQNPSILPPPKKLIQSRKEQEVSHLNPGDVLLDLGDLDDELDAAFGQLGGAEDKAPPPKRRSRE